MTGCWFSHGKFLIATQQLDWDLDTFVAILLQETSSVLSDLGAEAVGDIGLLDEFTGSGYSRETLVDTEVVEDIGERVRFVADNVSFAGLGNAPNRARWILIARDGASDAVRVPLFVIGRALGPIHPNGGTVSSIIEAIW